MMFLPRNDYSALEKCRTIIESELLDHGYYIYGWRQVPINNSVIGDKANSTRPEIEQVMFVNNVDREKNFDFSKEILIEISAHFYLTSLHLLNLYQLAQMLNF